MPPFRAQEAFEEPLRGGERGAGLGSLAFLLANLVSLLVHLLPREAQLAWGWRLPFLLAAPLGVASVLLRRHVPETESFRRAKGDEQAAPKATRPVTFEC